MASWFGFGWESRSADVGPALRLPVDGRELVYDGFEGGLLCILISVSYLDSLLHWWGGGLAEKNSFSF